MGHELWPEVMQYSLDWRTTEGHSSRPTAQDVTLSLCKVRTTNASWELSVRPHLFISETTKKIWYFETALKVAGRIFNIDSYKFNINASFPRLKRPERDAEHLLPSNAEVKFYLYDTKTSCLVKHRCTTLWSGA